MFTAAAAAASADVRAKRNRFASHRSFSASELNGIKRRQKTQTANALDILSTYLVVADEVVGSGGHHHQHFRASGTSARTSIASSRESSRACSPVPEEYFHQGISPRANTNSSSAHRSTASFSFFTNIFSSHHGSSSGHKASLPLPSVASPLNSSSQLSHSTSSIECPPGQAKVVPAAVEVVSILRDPAWSEIARLSHSDDMEDVDGHGHRCGHRRRYDRQSSPFDAYLARKRFISAINRIRMESMVCSALSSSRTTVSTDTNSSKGSSRKVSTTLSTEYTELTNNGNQQLQKSTSLGTGSRKGSCSSPQPPQVLINDGDEEEEGEVGHFTSTSSATISMAELRLNDTDQAVSPSSPSSTGKFWQRSTATPAARASSSPQIDQQTAVDVEDWVPLMQGRAIERSTSSANYRPPTHFTCESEKQLQQNQQQQQNRQRSSSATLTTMFLEQEAAAANKRSKSPNRSTEKMTSKCGKSHHSKHSFMALIRIKMFSVKRQRRQPLMKEEDEEEEKEAEKSNT